MSDENKKKEIKIKDLPQRSLTPEEQEALICKEGVALTPAQLEDAQRIGVTSPEQVRLRSVSEIPMPSHPLLRQAAVLAHHRSSGRGGLRAAVKPVDSAISPGDYPACRRSCLSGARFDRASSR